MEDLYNIIFSHSDKVMTVDASLVGPRSRKTYRQVREEIDVAARGILRAMKGETGRFVGLYGENKPEWMILFWAVLRSGNTPYLINLRQPEDFVADGLRSLEAPLTVSVDGSPNLGTKTLSYQDLMALSEEGHPSDGTSPAENLDGASPVEIPSLEGVPFGDGYALSTSGTTLSKKVCVYTGRNGVAQILNVEWIMKENPEIVRGHRGQIKHLMFLPLYHVFGLEAVFLWYSFLGSTFVFPPDMKPQNLLRTVRDHGVTHIFAVPLLWAAVEKNVRKKASEGEETRQKLEAGLRLSRRLQTISPKLGRIVVRHLFREVREKLFGDTLRFCISGGSFLKPSTLELINGLGYHLCNGYGMSEIGISSVDLSRSFKNRVSGSIGRPFPSVEYRIDWDGRLLVKGESLCSRMTVDGMDCPLTEWFNTGDLMEKNEKGQYFISGRASDLVFGEEGENLNPDLAEQAFLLTGAKNFTVTGDAGNEKLMLVVQVPEDLTQEQMELLTHQIARGNDSLPGAYRVREIRFTYDPILSSKEIKVSRARLRRQIQEGTVRLFETLSLPSATADHGGTDSPLKGELRQMFGEILGIPPEKITDTGHFMNDLGGSSLDYFTLMGRIEEQYGVTLEFEEEQFTYCLNDFVRIIGEKGE